MLRFISIIPIVTISLFTGEIRAELDLDRNGFSEIWELRYSNIGHAGDDPDGDSFSNGEEAIAGTDPEDAQSFLNLEIISVDVDGATVQWQGVGGKAYRIEQFNGAEWTETASFLPRPFSSIRSAVIPPTDRHSDLIRIKAFNLDLDQDGLTSWEEVQLGWSDNNRVSSGDVDRLDYVAAIRALEQQQGVTLADGVSFPQRLPNRSEAARFLMQASFGPSKAEITKVMSVGLSGWIDEQWAITPSLSAQTMWRNGLRYSATLWRDSWIKLAVDSPDQLRQRLAYSLSQIFVVGFQSGNWVGDNSLVQASFYDQFIKRASGRYRVLLNDIAYSPVMGFYLSHLRNRKSDPVTGRFPDENFAREIMQLFSIGLWELHPDGARKKDAEGLDIPTYDNAIITEMAKIFTGMTYSRNGVNNSAPSFYDGVGGNAFLYPMVVFDGEHEPGAKHLLNGIVLNDTENGGEALTPDEEVQATLDLLSEHENTAPFISHLLIQRFTSSNPRPSYIKRVVDAWNLNQLSETGNFRRVVEAILLDQDARADDDPNRGKVREPIVRLTHLLRAFDFRNAQNTYPFYHVPVKNALSQYPMLADSVFNFYLPAYSPPGEMTDLQLVSPEMQIADTAQLIDSDNFFKRLVTSGNQGVIPNFDDELALAGDVDELIDHLAEILSSTKLPQETHRAIAVAVDAQASDLAKVRTAVHLIVTSPNAATLR